MHGSKAHRSCSRCSHFLDARLKRQRRGKRESLSPTRRPLTYESTHVWLPVGVQLRRRVSVTVLCTCHATVFMKSYPHWTHGSLTVTVHEESIDGLSITVPVLVRGDEESDLRRGLPRHRHRQSWRPDRRNPTARYLLRDDVSGPPQSRRSHHPLGPQFQLSALPYR